MAQQQQPPKGNQQAKPPPRPQSFMTEEDQSALAQVMQPKSFDEWLSLCQLLAKSKIIPYEFRDKPGDIMIAVSLGGTIGLHWSQSLQSVCVLGGKPTLYGDVGRAKILESGELEEYEEKWDPNLDGGTATVTMKRRGLPAMTKSFSMSQAHKVRIYRRDERNQIIYKNGNPEFTTLADKDNYVNYGDEMCAWRARWRVWRALFADLLKGFVGREEYEEFAANRAQDVTPVKTDLPAPREKQEADVAAENAATTTQKPSEPQEKKPEPQQAGVAADISQLLIWQECDDCDFKGTPEEGLRHAMETEGKHSLVNCSRESEAISEEEQQLKMLGV